MKKKQKTEIGSVIAKHIELINRATAKNRSNPFLAMAVQAANEATNENKKK